MCLNALEYKQGGIKKGPEKNSSPLNKLYEYSYLTARKDEPGQTQRVVTADTQVLEAREANSTVFRIVGTQYRQFCTNGDPSEELRFRAHIDVPSRYST